MAVFTIGSKTLSGSPTGGAVGGASNLTTVGAIPYVSAAGVLGQDASNLFWDSTNHRLGVGTASPLWGITAKATGSGSQDIAVMDSSNRGVTLTAINGGTSYFGSNGAYDVNFRTNATDRVTINGTTGNLLLGTTTDLGYGLHAANKGTNGNLLVFDPTATTGNTKEVIRAGAGQTTELTEWVNYAGTTLAYVNSSGSLLALNVTASSDYVQASQRLIAPSIEPPTGNNLLIRSSSSGSTFSLFQFGGTTSSFPALKRSSAILQARLADDSADTSVQALDYIATLQTPASAAASGTQGTIKWDANYIYICTAANTWKRVAIATW